MRKPKCGWKPPFQLEHSGEAMYRVVDANNTIVTELNYKDDEGNLHDKAWSLYYALNLAYPVKKRRKK